MEINPSLERFKKFGNKTSSAISLYSHFDSYIEDDLEIRFTERKNLIAIANEPLSDSKIRANKVEAFFEQSKYRNHDKLIFPISENLGQELKGKGFNIWQVGSEPIFVLKEYFKNDDYLNNFPIAKSLKKRGAKVREIDLDEYELLADQLEEIKEHWLSKKKLSGVGFLNTVNLEELRDLKRYFILEDRNKVVAYLTALPIFLNNQVIGYFYNDIIKGGNSRSATCELLILESMKKMHEEGIFEVRLGMSPLANIRLDSKDSKFLNSIFEKWKLGYNFKSLFNFKNKMRPTYWRPIYLASNQKNIKLIFVNILRLHLTLDSLKEYGKRTWFGLKQNLKTNSKVQSFKRKIKANNLINTIERVKYTIGLSSLFISLHILKNKTDFFASLFESSAFQASNYNLKGLLLGSFFHNHFYHLFGDQLSFLIFGGLIEFWFGSYIFWGITTLGLWLSNPLTHLFLASNLKFIKPEAYSRMLIEKDYGSSNAVFALIGATVFSLERKSWLLIPMLFHALFICLQRESFLSIHHFTGMYIGYSFMGWYYTLKMKKN